MLRNLGIGASLMLVPHQGVVFIPPDLHIEDDGPLLYGDVVITLPKARDVDRIIVRHWTSYEINVPGSAPERGQLYVNETEIHIGSRLDKGSHRFSWIIRLTKETVPYERTAYGSVTPHLEAIAHGGGLMGKPLQASACLRIATCPSLVDGIPPYDRRLEGFLDELGAYAIGIKSPMLTVGGLLHVSVALPSVPTDIRMTAVTVRIIQYFDIRLPSDRERSISAPFQVVDVLTLNGGSPREHPLSGPVTEPDVIFTAAAKPDDPALLAVIPAGQSLELACFTRVPTTRRIRPTTIQQGTSMPIRISHEIRFEIQYRTPTSKERVARLSQPISFISCAIGAGLLLPCYSKATDCCCCAAHYEDVERALHRCICKRSTADLIADYGGFTLEPAGSPAAMESRGQRPKADYAPGPAMPDTTI